ncbi:MAG: hypothetical protein HC772_18870 [Leptolyngbyaceae cyanobacterium CRU_2_3]|nr:hypothetical protein [Leptolyngbyaceae cyanobacterium CRU_2_3]
MYIYAFLPNPTRLLALPLGISGSLQIIAVKDLAALVELDLDVLALQDSDERLMQAILAHDRVTRAVFQQTTLLPPQVWYEFCLPTGIARAFRNSSSRVCGKAREASRQSRVSVKADCSALS